MKAKEMSASEIRKKSAAQIELDIANERDRLRKFRFQQVTGQLSDPSAIPHIRRYIARMETILKEMAQNAQTGGAQ